MHIRLRRHMKRILKGLARVESANAEQRYVTPDGRYPVCRPAIGTTVCDRCGSIVAEMRRREVPCPAIPREQRWDMRYPQESGRD